MNNKIKIIGKGDKQGYMRFSERTKIILNSYFRERDMMIIISL